jgi:hypothetical protein
MTKNISVLYSFPRSGGTLINQCLLCAKDTIVLSEINPTLSVIDPILQASNWFRLFTNEEICQTRTYLQQIKAIHEKTELTNSKLIIRDWSGINYLREISEWVPAPSFQLEQHIYLTHAGFELHEARVIRQSTQIFISLRKDIPQCANLSIESFAESYSKYLSDTAHVFTVHLEDFTQETQSYYTKLCSALSIEASPGVKEKFSKEIRVTGNTTISTKPTSAKWKTIHACQLPDVNKETQAIIETNQKLFRDLDTLAGYV